MTTPTAGAGPLIGGGVALALAVLGRPVAAVAVGALALSVSRLDLLAPRLAFRLHRGLALLGDRVGRGLTWLAIAGAFLVVVLPGAGLAAVSRAGRRLAPRGDEAPSSRPKVGGAAPQRPFAEASPSRGAGARVLTAAAIVLLVVVGALVLRDSDRRQPDAGYDPARSAALAAQPEIGPTLGEESELKGRDDAEVGFVVDDHVGDHVNVSDGVRRSLPPPPGRAVTLWLFGGSAAFGSGQRDDHTIASHLVRAAATDGLALTVTNRGTLAHSATQGAANLRRALADTSEPPDVAVLYDGYNDVALGLASPLAGIPPGEPMDARSPDRQVEEQPPGLGARLGPFPSTQERVAGLLTVYTAAIESARSAGAAASVEVVPVWQPSVYTREPTDGEWDVLRAIGFDTWLFDRWQQVTEAVRAELPADVVDLSQSLDDAPSVYFDTVHTSERGAAIVARALYRHLRPILLDRAEP